MFYVENIYTAFTETRSAQRWLRTESHNRRPLDVIATFFHISSKSAQSQSGIDGAAEDEGDSTQAAVPNAVECSARFFNAGELRAWLDTQKSESGIGSKQTGILQSFVAPMCLNNDVIRVVWSPESISILSRLNTNRLDENRMGVFEKAVTWEEDEYLDHRTLATMSTKEQDLYTKRVNTIHKATKTTSVETGMHSR